MKKNSFYLLILMVLFACNSLQAQVFVGRLAAGSTINSVDCYIRPNYTDNRYFSNISFAISIPDSYSPVPTAAITPGTLVPNELYSADPGNPIHSGNRYYYAFTAHQTNTTTVSFTSGVEFIAATINFVGGSNVNSSIVQQNDAQVSSGGGGTLGNVQFYVETGGQGQVSPDPTVGGQLFYTATGTLGSANGTSGGGDQYSVTNSTVVLPVTLIDFTAAKSSEACAINLKWQVTAEVNFKNYEIQRSNTSNGLNYKTIATIAAQGISNYASTDASPVSGINYYRLKMNDNDGHFTYSKIIPVNSNCNGTIIQVWPNPAISTVNVTGLNGKNSLAVLDAIGKQVATFTTTNIFQKIDMSKFSRGNYSILITGADGSVTTLKLVKL